MNAVMTWILVCTLALLGAGCHADGTQSSWQEVWKDVRGDNMKMTGDCNSITGRENW